MLTLASFRRATQRDFGNGAFRDEIEKVIESRDELLTACKELVECVAAHSLTCSLNEYEAKAQRDALATVAKVERS